MSLLRSAAPLRRLATASSSIRFASTTSAPLTVTSTRSNASAPLLANIEASWKDLASEEQFEVYQQLEALQKKDWKELSVDEKKAAYFVAFGPHGPRAPTHEPGHNSRVLFGTLAACGVAFGLFTAIRSQAAPPPRTMTREWQEAANEAGKEANLNPISGVASENFKGKGFISM